MKRKILCMGMIIVLSLGMIGCGNKKGTEQNSSEENTESLSAKEETESWLTDGYYTWEENDFEYTETQPYGELTGRMVIGVDENLKFRQEFFYPDGTEVHLLGGTDTGASKVEMYGKEYRVLENGDIEFNVIGGHYPNGRKVHIGSDYSTKITWYYHGTEDYRLEDGTQITKLAGDAEQPDEVQQENDVSGNDTKVIDLEHPGYSSPDALVADYLEAVSNADYAKMVSVRLPYKFDLMMSLEEDYQSLHYDRFKHFLPEEYLEVLIGLEDDLDEVYYNYKEENDNTYIGTSFTWDTWKEACGEEKAPDAITDWCQKNVPEYSPIVAGYQYKVTIDSPNYNGNGTPTLEFNMVRDADGKYYLLTVQCSELD